MTAPPDPYGPMWRAASELRNSDVPIYVATEKDFARHSSFDLVDWSKVACYYLPPKACIEWLKLRIAALYGIAPERQRYWIWVARSNGSYRPDRPLLRQQELTPVRELRTCNFWLEVLRTPSPLQPSERLIFFKTFNCKTGTLSYLGHAYVMENFKVADLDPLVARMVPSKGGARPLYFEEVRPSMINALSPWVALQKEEISTGDIIIVHPSYSMKDSSAVTVMFSMITGESTGLPAEFPSAREAEAVYSLRKVLMRPSDDDLFHYAAIPNCMIFLVYDDQPHTSWGIRLHECTLAKPAAPVLAPAGRRGALSILRHTAFAEFPMLKIDQTDFTICMWFCAPNLPVATGWLLSAWSHHENEQKFRLCFGPNPLRASISITATLNFVAPDVPSVVCTGGSLEKGTWHHVAMTWRRADRLLTLFVDAVEAAHAQLPEGVSSLTLRPTPSKWQLGRSPTGDWERCHMTDICVLSRAADVDSLRRIAIGNRPCLLARLFAIAPLDCLALDFDALRKVAVRNKGKERLAALHDEGDREADKEHAASLALNGPNADIKIDFVGREKGSLLAHREVLCRRSDYFRNLLDGPMSKGVSKDKNGNLSVSIAIAGLPFSLFSRIISSLYNGGISLEMDELDVALEALDYFSLSKKCVARLLKQKFTPVRPTAALYISWLETVMDSLRYAGEYNAPEIRQVAIDYILAHFDDMEAAFAAAPREERIELATEVIADMPTIRSFLIG